MKKMPEAYRGREQAYVKHTVLKAYLQRLFMIIGQSKESTINYVDCFAGPWQENDEQLSDTSIGISLAQIDLCRQGLMNTFGREVHFRALYVEKNPAAFRKLENYLSTNPYPCIETRCLEGDYTDLSGKIVQWCGSHFTFFFVDPKGWLHVGPNSMRPLLELPNSEFLITLMYDFVNRAVTIAKHDEDMIALFGKIPPVAGSDPESRRSTQLQLYRAVMTAEYCGKSTYVPVEKPGRDRVHYFLIYLTRNARGLITFKEIAETMEILQRDVQTHVKMRVKADNTGMDDLFGGEPEIGREQPSSSDLQAAKEFLMQQFSGKEVRIDIEIWADLLEISDFFPSELQAAMKSLMDDGLAENLDASVTRRTKNVVKADYANKSERWLFKTA